MIEPTQEELDAFAFRAGFKNGWASVESPARSMAYQAVLELKNRFPREPDDTKVICPKCTHEFRAVPVQVQGLLLAAGYKPPFMPLLCQACGKTMAEHDRMGHCP